MQCPGCRQAMEMREVDRIYGRTMAIDLCRACHLLWFDDLELLQLSPGATLDLLTSRRSRTGPAAARPAGETTSWRPVCARSRA